MFVIKDDQSIHLTRGDVANIVVTATTQDGSNYVFSTGDIVRLKIMKRNDPGVIIIEKRVTVEEQTEFVTIFLSSEDTRLGEVINRPIDYWYEIELNPEIFSQTIIGYDDKGAKIFRLYPEGGDYS